MSRFLGMIAVIGALAVAGVATDASAQSKLKKPDTSTYSFDQNAWGSAAGDKALQWNGKGRWGLKLDYDQPTQRDVQWKDVDAGLAFRINRHLQIAGTLNLDTSQTLPTRASPDEKPQPRVQRFLTASHWLHHAAKRPFSA